MPSRKPILVTGSHRSGTTWVGKMIAASPQVGYIHEPFNLNYPPHPGIWTGRVPYWFTYITEENELILYEHLKNTLSFHYDIKAGFSAIRSMRGVGRMLIDRMKCSLYHFREATPLLKDPIALFSSEWLTSRFDMNTIIMIRHPAGFVSSLRRLNWPQRHHFSNFLQQPLLMRDHLSPFEAEITEFANKEHDILAEAALLWKIIHYVILKYKDAHRDWIFLRHEDISEDPLYYFEYLFKRCGLDFSAHVQAVIQDYTNFSNPSEAPRGQLFGKLDSKSNAKSWKMKFTEAEITQLRERVEDISKEFYLNSDW